MTRLFASLSAAALLAATAHAQCPKGVDAGLVNYDLLDGYASIYGASDEGISNPPIALTAFASFPMPGAVGTLDQLWVGSNGEVYLADSTLLLTEPVDAALYGVSSAAELSGTIAGATARVVAMGADHQESGVAGAIWSVTVDQSVAGEVRITWIDIARYATPTDRFSFVCTLFANGNIRFDYGTTIPAATRYVGVSVGNLEPTSGSQDLTTLPSSGATNGAIYQAFTAATWDLNGSSVLIVPNFTAGVENYSVSSVTAYTPPAVCASNVPYGFGCHSIPFPDSVYELFPDQPTAKAALDGNGLLFTRTALGYDASWLPGVAGGLYVAPTLAATSLTFADTDDGNVAFTPSAPIPVPGGTVATWNASVNGILTAAAVANNDSDYIPDGEYMTNAFAPNLGFYTWHDFNVGEAGSGPVQIEEAGGILYVTWAAVEAYGTPSPNPATFQFQVNMTSGDVIIVWLTMDASTYGGDTLIGCTLAGAGADPGSMVLATALPISMRPSIEPMSLSGSPAPVINPSTNVTYVAGNLPEFVPGSGIYLSTMFLSVNPNPGGFDLNGILTTVAGCNAWIVTLDLDLGAQLTFAPTAMWTFTYDNVFFAPGNVIAAQAVSLFDTNFPLINGEAGGFRFSNGVLSTTQLQ
jgi:hypothetical protein